MAKLIRKYCGTGREIQSTGDVYIDTDCQNGGIVEGWFFEGVARSVPLFSPVPLNVGNSIHIVGSTYTLFCNRRYISFTATKTGKLILTLRDLEDVGTAQNDATAAINGTFEAIIHTPPYASLAAMPFSASGTAGNSLTLSGVAGSNAEWYVGDVVMGTGYNVEIYKGGDFADYTAKKTTLIADRPAMLTDYGGFTSYAAHIE